jgi:hypothetical protein
VAVYYASCFFSFSIASFFNDFGSDMIYPIWPLFITSVLSANMAILGLIDGLGEAIVSLSQAASGYLADKFQKKILNLNPSKAPLIHISISILRLLLELLKSIGKILIVGGGPAGNHSLDAGLVDEARRFSTTRLSGESLSGDAKAAVFWRVAPPARTRPRPSRGRGRRGRPPRASSGRR